MIRKQRGAISWLEFELLQPFAMIRHGCFSRLSLTDPRSPSIVPQTEKPFHRTVEMTSVLFDAPPPPVLTMNQVHGSQVEIIMSPHAPTVPCDGMATSLPNIGLCVLHADCQACLFFDPEHHVIAGVHSGWRGSTQNIYKTAVESLTCHYGTRAEHLLACISPSLGPCHAEFIHWNEELPPSFAQFRRQGAYFDFWEASRHQLLACGLAPDHIEIAALCTRCLPDLFFSYRFDKTKERNATSIALIDPSR